MRRRISRHKRRTAGCSGRNAIVQHVEPLFQGVIWKSFSSEGFLVVRRWTMLTVFALCSMVNAFQWIAYSIISDRVRDFYSVPLIAVDWLSMIYMLVYIPLVFRLLRFGERWLTHYTATGFVRQFSGQRNQVRQRTAPPLWPDFLRADRGRHFPVLHTGPSSPVSGSVVSRKPSRSGHFCWSVRKSGMKSSIQRLSLLAKVITGWRQTEILNLAKILKTAFLSSSCIERKTTSDLRMPQTAQLARRFCLAILC